MKAGLAIEELAAEIMRQNEIKEDYVVNSQSLLMECYDSEMFLRVMDAEGAAGSRVAIAVGVLIIFYGVVCAFKWRRYSLERRDSLQQSRKKR